MNFDYYHYKYRERMKYQKIISFLDKTNQQPSKLNAEYRRRYHPGGKIKFKTAMLRSLRLQ